MGSTPYQHYVQNPVELHAEGYGYAAHEEEQDQLRPLSIAATSTPPVSPPISAPPMAYGGAAHSPQMSTGSIHSQTEDVPAPVRQQIIQRKSVASGDSGRLSRQSEASGLS